MEPKSSNENDQSRALTLTADQQQALVSYQGSPQVMLESDMESGVDLREYWNIIWARKGTVLLVATVFVIAALINTSMKTPLYKASGTIKINQHAEKVVQYETTLNSGFGGNFISTQLELIKSKALALKVVDQLGLGMDKLQTPEADKDSFFDSITNVVRSWLGKPVPEDNSLEDEKKSEIVLDSGSSARSSAYANALLRGLSVGKVKDSSLVKISYVSADRKLTAKVVNAVIAEYIQSNLERDYSSSSYAKEFLDERIKKVRADLEESEAKLIAYAQKLDMVDLDSSQGTNLEKVKGLSALLTQAEAARYKAEAEYQQLNAEGGENSIYVLENPVIQAYKQKLVFLETEYEKKLKIFKPGYPDMVQLRSEMDEVESNIIDEIENLKGAVQAKYKAAVAEEAMLRARLAEIRKDVMATHGQSNEYQTLKRDVDANRQIYDALMQRMKEVDVVSGSSSSLVSIIDPAETPGGAFSPNLRKNLRMALIFGLLCGVGVAFLFDYLDDTIKSSADLEKITRLAVLGLVPDADVDDSGAESVGLISARDPTSAIAEAYRSIRTSLSFATASGAPDILHFTSAGPGEGKTTSAMSLASAYTQAGSNVLLIDADLRNPSLHAEFVLPNDIGLTNYLTGDQKPSQVVQKTQVPNLWVLPTGPIPPNPAELLAGGKMLDLVTSASQRFDLVIIDSPPVLGLADALVLANMAKATLLVVDSGKTRKGAVENALQRLQRTRANVIGSILTRHAESGGRYGYDYNYSYSYGTEDDNQGKQYA